MPRVAFTVDQVEAAGLRLRDAALRVFEREGWKATTMRSIAREAGYSAATSYLYFRDKRALLTALRAEGFRDLTARLADAWSGGAGALDRMARVFSGYLGFGVARPEIYRLMFELRQGDDAKRPEAREHREAAFGYARRVAAELLAERRIEGDETTLAHLLWLSCHGLMSLHLAHQLDLGADFDELVGPFVEHWRRSLGPARKTARSLSARRPS